MNCSHTDGILTWVDRRTNERHSDCCVLEIGRIGGDSLMVWGGLIVGQKTDLFVMQGNLNARRYIDDVLRPHIIPFLHNQCLGVIFQHDNAKPHTSLITWQIH